MPSDPASSARCAPPVAAAGSLPARHRVSAARRFPPATSSRRSTAARRPMRRGSRASRSARRRRARRSGPGGCAARAFRTRGRRRPSAATAARARVRRPGSGRGPEAPDRRAIVHPRSASTRADAARRPSTRSRRSGARWTARLLRGAHCSRERCPRPAPLLARAARRRAAYAPRTTRPRRTLPLAPRAAARAEARAAATPAPAALRRARLRRATAAHRVERIRRWAREQTWEAQGSRRGSRDRCVLPSRAAAVRRARRRATGDERATPRIHAPPRPR